MSEHEFSEVITWPFAMTSEEISVWHKASPRMRKHVAALKLDRNLYDKGWDAALESIAALKRDRDRFRDDLNAIYEWLAVEFPDAFASLQAKVLNPDALLAAEE